MTLPREIPGIHHITAIAGNPQENIDFYAGVLGLRLVKLTVNYDDPTTYHLYFGDEQGRPGTILTFFPWPGAPKGRKGSGQAVAVSFSIPENAVEFWTGWLKANGIPFQGPVKRFSEQVVSFSDPDGLNLELVAHPRTWKGNPREWGPIPAEFAIRGFYNVTLSEEGHQLTVLLLTRTMGFRKLGMEEGRFRFETADGGPGAMVDILREPDMPRGFVSVGTVHHVAWRTPSDGEQKAWRERLVVAGLSVTPIIDRKYFHSIYYREPGGVLFEIATDPPGFTVDQPLEELGKRLMLPPWLEPRRRELEQVLPRVQPPKLVPAH